MPGGGRRWTSSAALIGAVVAVAVTVPTERVSSLETELFRAVNDLPDGLLPIVWLPMQSGSFAAVPIAGVLTLVSRGRRPAAVVATAGLVAYTLAKGVKRASGRPRPADILRDVRQRGARQTGEGFPSGHAAVSAALASAAFPELTTGWRTAVASLAVAAPFGRIYVGAHLPLDVLGGSALGLAVGSLARRIVDRSRSFRRPADLAARPSLRR
jgi:membrane-associated phospholipid phosphatase